MSKFRFFIASLANPIGRNDPVLGEKLPLNRGSSLVPNEKSVSIGEYFEAVETLLSENDMGMTVASIYGQSGRRVCQENIDSISVFLEKHGEFYHPSRIVVESGDDDWEFVLNVAVSEAGLRRSEKEFRILKKLSAGAGKNYVPRVFEHGFVETPVRKRRFAMFSGDWFSGFHEFHISSKATSDKGRIRVWDPDRSDCFLTEKQTYDLYRGVAFVLTYYFNPESFEQIHPWSHAAGDFVLKIENDHLRVKLISVRGYKALFRGDENDLASLMGALSAFLADLSVKNRLDRFDGVGEIAWADEISVLASIDGFFGGFRERTKGSPDFEIIPDYFALYLDSMEESSVMELIQDVVSSFSRQAPETTFVKDKIAAHAFLFYRSTRKFLASDFEKKTRLP